MEIDMSNNVVFKDVEAQLNKNKKLFDRLTIVFEKAQTVETTSLLQFGWKLTGLLLTGFYMYNYYPQILGFLLKNHEDMLKVTDKLEAIIEKHKGLTND
jgi:hypothetical protein